MARPSVLERLLPLVEGYVDDLEGRRRERLLGLHGEGDALDQALASSGTWDGPERLPATNDGKVNVQALINRLGLRESDRQWFYKSDDLAGPINALAAAQGLKPIRSRIQQSSDDEAAVAAVSRAKFESKRLTETLLEVTRERDQLRAQLRMIREVGWTMRVDVVEDNRR